MRSLSRFRLRALVLLGLNLALVPSTWAAAGPDCGTNAFALAFEETEKGTQQMLKALPAGKEAVTLAEQVKGARTAYEQLSQEAAALRKELKDNKSLTQAQRIEKGARATAKETESMALRARISTLQEEGRYYSLRDALATPNGPARQTWSIRSQGLAAGRRELEQNRSFVTAASTAPDERTAIVRSAELLSNANRTGAKLERDIDEMARAYAERFPGQSPPKADASPQVRQNFERSKRMREQQFYDELSSQLERRTQSHGVTSSSSEWEIYRVYTDAQLALRLARTLQSNGGTLTGNMRLLERRVADIERLAAEAGHPVADLEKAVQTAGSGSRTAPAELRSMDPVFKPF